MVRQLKKFRWFITLAAMLFVAKPFLGFSTVNYHTHPNHIHTILVKSFSKRKPESLEEANAHVESIHKLISNPLTVLCSAISLLLVTLFPWIFRTELKITQGILSDIRYALLPPEHTYLLAGKLII